MTFYIHLLLNKKRTIKKYKENIEKYEKIIENQNRTIFDLFILIENKKEFILKNPKSIVIKNVCGNCFKLCVKEKNKCILPNCLGICDECVGLNESKCDDMCLSCNKKEKFNVLFVRNM